MKKTIAYILLFALCMAVLTGCEQQAPAADPTQAPAEAPTAEPVVSAEPVVEPEPIDVLANAKAYIRMVYKNAAAKTPVDYFVSGNAMVNDESLPVSWNVVIAEGGEATAVVVGEIGEDGMIKIDINEACPAETAYTLIATITDKDGNTADVSFDHIVPMGFDIGTASYDEIVEAAYELEDGAYLPETVRLYGTVTEIPTAYSAEYNNITVNMVIAGMEDKFIQCYRLSGEGADTLAIGDKITVEGSIKNYKGTFEFDKGCILVGHGDHPYQAKLLKNAYALEDGAAFVAPTALRGIISKIDTPYSEEYKNITVTIVCDGIEDMPIQCYRLCGEGAADLAEGMEIAVYGTIKNYKGTIEFDKNCVLIPVESVSDAKTVAKAYQLEDGQTMKGIKTLTGTIVEIPTPFSAEYNNITVNMVVGGLSENVIQCYRLTGEGADALAIGDTITVTGVIKNYKGTIEFDKNCTFTK